MSKLDKGDRLWIFGLFILLWAEPKGWISLIFLILIYLSVIGYVVMQFKPTSNTRKKKA